MSLSLRLLASLSLRVSGSLLFPNILPEPPGSRAGGAGQWERDSVLFSPRTMRAGKGWSQGLAASAPRALPPRPSGVPDMPVPFVQSVESGLCGSRTLPAPSPLPAALGHHRLPQGAPCPQASTCASPPHHLLPLPERAAGAGGVGATCEGAGGNIWLLSSRGGDCALCPRPQPPGWQSPRGPRAERLAPLPCSPSGPQEPQWPPAPLPDGG